MDKNNMFVLGLCGLILALGAGYVITKQDFVFGIMMGVVAGFCIGFFYANAAKVAV